jgi:hypothetical protein
MLKRKIEIARENNIKLVKSYAVKICLSCWKKENANGKEIWKKTCVTESFPKSSIYTDTYCNCFQGSSVNIAITL